MERKLYQAIASACQARLNCIKSGNTEWEGKHEERIESLVKEHMPSGSGFDSGTQFDFDASTPDKLVFNTSYHHMDENGMYDNWTDHSVIVRPSLAFGYYLRVTGRDVNQFKEYAHDCFSCALDKVVNEYPQA